MSEHGTDLIVLTPFVSVPTGNHRQSTQDEPLFASVDFFTANIQNPNTQ